MYSVVVVGAGPAGLMAGRALLNSQQKFLIIDKKDRIGIPLSCGEATREEGFLELFGSSDFPFVKNRPKRFEVRCNTLVREFTLGYLMLDRPRFEEHLAKPLKSHLKLKTECQRVEIKSEGVEITTNRGKLKAALVILACGCSFKLQKQLKLIEKPPLVIPCYGGIFSGHNLNPNTLYFSFDEPTWSALWMFPKDSNVANVGIGVFPGAKQSIKDLFVSKIRKLKLKCEQEYAGVFPTSGPIAKTYADRVLVCGDAAGQVLPGIGEGIYFALKSGKLAGNVAGKAVKASNFSASMLREYESQWKSEIGSILYAGLIASRLLFLGFKFRVLEKAFQIPTERELVGIALQGKLPFRARLLYNLARGFGLFKRDKTHLPQLIKSIGKMY
ncbi:NAD(P)/FAD-dependent oxidoreductase, partial [Candidatus Woesearchaeota archaeon]|nr:NAD(P)/FAD-dependent oxidoreductase [Candidatus Woesearchaeota archaeon]